MHTYIQGLWGLDSAAECSGPIASIRDTTHTHTYPHKQMINITMIDMNKTHENKQKRSLTCMPLTHAPQTVLYDACHQDEESH